MNQNTAGLTGAALFLISLILRYFEQHFYQTRFYFPRYGGANADVWFLKARLIYFTQSFSGLFLWLIWLATFAGGLWFIWRSYKLSRENPVSKEMVQTLEEFEDQGPPTEE